MEKSSVFAFHFYIRHIESQSGLHKFISSTMRNIEKSIPIEMTAFKYLLNRIIITLHQKFFYNDYPYLSLSFSLSLSACVGLLKCVQYCKYDRARVYPHFIAFRRFCTILHKLSKLLLKLRCTNFDSLNWIVMIANLSP